MEPNEGSLVTLTLRQKLFLLGLIALLVLSISGGVPPPPPLRVAHKKSLDSLLGPANADRCLGGRGWGGVRAPPASLLERPAPSTHLLHPRVVVLMLDDRKVAREMPHTHSGQTTYPSICAVNNYLWARRNGYDFAMFHPAVAANLSSIGGGVEALKGLQKPACFNSGLGRWRGLSWCKILAMWAASVEEPLEGAYAGGKRYDYILFLDSDAVVTHLSSNVSDAFAEFHFRAWRNDFVHTNIVYGEEGGSMGTEAGPSLFFYSDRQPSGRQYANLGFVLARDSPQLRPMLKTWWSTQPGHDVEKFDYEPHMEQAVMWRMQEAGEESPPADAMKRVIQVSDAPWAPMQEASWLTHVTSEEDRSSWGEARKFYFGSVLQRLNLTESSWRDTVDEMNKGCHLLPLDLDGVDREMQAYAKGLEALTPRELWSPAQPPRPSGRGFSLAALESLLL